MPILSIIIPHYNTPDLLKRCLSSIPNNDMFQVIVIDDSSSQNNQDDLVNLKVEFPYVEFIFCVDNCGPGRCRNIGIEKSIGRWIMFADSDDFFVSNLGDIIQQYYLSDADIVFFNTKSVMSDDVSKPSKRTRYDDLFIDYSKNKNDGNFRYCHHSPCAKMIKTSLLKINQIKFEEIRFGEDALFSVQVGCCATKVQIVNEIIYIITERNESITSSFCKTEQDFYERLNIAIKCQKIVDLNKHKLKYSFVTPFVIISYSKGMNSFIKTMTIIHNNGISLANIICQLFSIKIRNIRAKIFN